MSPAGTPRLFPDDEEGEPLEREAGGAGSDPAGPRGAGAGAARQDEAGKEAALASPDGRPAPHERLNPRQRQAVTHPGGPILVLAGAGSGKTRVLTHRIAWLIDEAGVPARAICAVTFTNKAAAEMRQRVRALLGRHPAGLWLSTFHSLGLRLLREWSEQGHAPGTDLVPPPGFAVYDRDASLAVWRRCQQALRISAREYDPGRLLSRCSGAVNRMEDPAAWDDGAASWERRIAGRIWKAYRRAMAEARALDFDDLLHRPLRILTTDPELQQETRQRFQHLLVDEYQDTNRIQYRLLRALLGPDENLLVVGDEDQSIYRWRGADLGNVLDFQKDFPGAEVVRLEQNYRSTQPILSAAGSLVAHNRERLGKELWTELEGGDRPVFVLCATDRQEAGWVAEEIQALQASAGGPAGGEDAARGGRPVGAGRGGTPPDGDRGGRGPRAEPPGRRGSRAHGAGPAGAPPLSEIAILYRTNAQSRIFEEVFLARRIPHRIVGGQRFFARREIRDAMAWLQLLVRPDDVALRRAAATPSRGVGAVTLRTLAATDDDGGAAAALEAAAGADDPAEALRETGVPPAAVGGLLEIAAIVAKLRELAAELPLPDLVRETIRRSGYDAALEDEPDAADRRDNLDQLVAAAQEALAGEGGDVEGGVDDVGDVGDDGGGADDVGDGSRSTGGDTGSSHPGGRGDAGAAGAADDPTAGGLEGLTAFLDRVALLADSETEAGRRDGVRLMTVHAAKGLEFDTVFLAGLEEELFPHASALADGHLEEERRLAYVGMTRARRRLFLSAARSRRLHGRDRWQDPSRFIKEIDPRHLEIRDELAELTTATTGGSGSRRRFSARGSHARGKTPSRGGAPWRGAGVPRVKRSAPEPPPRDLSSVSTRPAAEDDLVPGADVQHPMFGPGRVLESAGSGERLKLTIRFRKAGTKTVLARFARLEVPA